MSDTPRTDKETGDGWSGDAAAVSVEFSQQLERELNTTRNELLIERQAIDNLKRNLHECELELVRVSEVARLRAVEIETLKALRECVLTEVGQEPEPLECMSSCGCGYGCPPWQGCRYDDDIKLSDAQHERDHYNHRAEHLATKLVDAERKLSLIESIPPGGTLRRMIPHKFTTDEFNELHKWMIEVPFRTPQFGRTFDEALVNIEVQKD